MTTEIKNRGVCSTCHKIADLHHEEREGKIVLIKECADCGTTETIVSNDAERYNAKRNLMNYKGEAQQTCSLDCVNCKAHRTPTLVFIDVTNRCNMNCPICLANIPAMGFRFDPPMAYFEKIFEKLTQMDPKPKIQLFGGEPTCREDLIDMINLAKEKYGLQARVVTNGLRLANEEYCKKLVSTGAQLMYSFDGNDPEIYSQTRKHPKAFERKLKGLENLGKYRKSKVTLMTCVGEDINDKHMADLVQFCHDRRSYIAALDLIPLTAHWGPEEIEQESATIEDVERIMEEEIPGLSFFPAGLIFEFKALQDTFDMGRVTFGGAHPNCESVSLMVSDGEQYRPFSYFLKGDFNELRDALLALDKRMEEKLPKSILGKIFGRKGRQTVYGWKLLRLALKYADRRKIFDGAAFPKIMKILWAVVTGKKMKHALRANTKCHSILRMIILPFEEAECVESARLVECPAAFAYEHPETKDIRLMPVCSWAIHKDDILRVTAQEYGLESNSGEEGMTGLKKREDVDTEISAE